jgi:hypothetical protein
MLTGPEGPSALGLSRGILALTAPVGAAKCLRGFGLCFQGALPSFPTIFLALFRTGGDATTGGQPGIGVRFSDADAPLRKLSSDRLLAAGDLALKTRAPVSPEKCLQRRVYNETSATDLHSSDFALVYHGVHFCSSDTCEFTRLRDSHGERLAGVREILGHTTSRSLSDITGQLVSRPLVHS